MLKRAVLVTLTIGVLAGVLHAPAVAKSVPDEGEIRVGRGNYRGSVDLVATDPGSAGKSSNRRADSGSASAGGKPVLTCDWGSPSTGTASEVAAAADSMGREYVRGVDPRSFPADKPLRVESAECSDGAYRVRIVDPEAEGTEEAVTPEVLAQQARGTLKLPRPKPRRYPAEVLPDGRPYTMVRMPTWFWTDASTFKPLSKRTQAGGTWAEVTATPVALTFNPGNDDEPVSCAGPGTPFRRGVHAALEESPSGCQYRYRRSSFGHPDGQLTATYGIRWRISWVGSGDTSGALPDMTTTTTATFAVAEAQAVVVQ